MCFVQIHLVLLLLWGGIIAPPPGEFVRGDMNLDGQVTVADASFYLDILFIDGGQRPCADAFDVDDDGGIPIDNLEDGRFLMDWLFRTAPTAPLPAPFPHRDEDPTPDAITCVRSGPSSPPAPVLGYSTAILAPPAIARGQENVPFFALATTRGPVGSFSMAYRVRKDILQNVRVDFSETIVPAPFRSQLGASPFVRSVVLPTTDADFNLLLVAVVFAVEAAGDWQRVPFPATTGRVDRAPLVRIMADVRPEAPLGPVDAVLVPALKSDFFVAGDFVHGVLNEYGGLGGNAGDTFRSNATDDGGVVIIDGYEFLRGDSNASLAVDISDATFTLNYLFLGKEAPKCLDLADANDDGDVDLSDATFTLGYLFLGTVAPPEPGPRSCGFDLTPDGFVGCPKLCR